MCLGSAKICINFRLYRGKGKIFINFRSPVVCNRICNNSKFHFTEVHNKIQMMKFSMQYRNKPSQLKSGGELDIYSTIMNESFHEIKTNHYIYPLVCISISVQSYCLLIHSCTCSHHTEKHKHIVQRNTNTPCEETHTHHTNKHTHTILRTTNTPHQMKQ